MIDLLHPPEKEISFPTDYQSIIDRLASINPLQYGKTRNYIQGAVTHLSPYISRGVISVKQVQEVAKAKRYHPAEIEKFLKELAWREYFQRVWQAKGDDMFLDIQHPQTDVVHRKMIKGIAEATTGISIIDKCIQELYETGYMHNHVRMYVASLVCNIGKAHWYTPSQWMYYHLLDGDQGSNTCSWQWVAGAFASKKYYCNQENINLHTNSYQKNTFVDISIENLPQVPLPDELRQLIELSLTTDLPKVNRPNFDDAKNTLIYNSYNLDPLWRKDEDVNRILLLEPTHFQRYPVSKKVIQFIIDLANNIPGIQIIAGEVSDLISLYQNSKHKSNNFISKEHPAFRHYPGIKDERDWMYPGVTGYYHSFSSFWKACEKQMNRL
jgi:deoxyribodipyrimidine photo-lyase